jgi:hypothetical protein
MSWQFGRPMHATVDGVPVGSACDVHVEVVPDHYVVLL